MRAEITMPAKLITPGSVPDSTDESSPMRALQHLRIVIRAAQRHSAWIEKHCGVSGTQLWIMQEIHESPGIRVGDIARKLAVHQTTVSNLLDALGKLGLVVKNRDPGDQRVVRLSLSAPGGELLMRAPKPARGLLPEALHKMSEEELAQLNQGLLGLLNKIDAVDDESALQPLPFTM
jgi:DNA-binding MarR family transcriptional regulator